MSSVADRLRPILGGLGRHPWLWAHVRRKLPALGGVLLLSLSGSAVSISLPYLSKLIIDRGLIGRDFSRP